MLVEALIAFLVISAGIVVCLQGLAQSLEASKKAASMERWVEGVKQMAMGTSWTLDLLDPDFRNLRKAA